MPPDEPELLPCPHCGSDSINVYQDSEWDDWLVICHDCPSADRKKAIENWNKRVREGA